MHTASSIKHQASGHHHITQSEIQRKVGANETQRQHKQLFWPVARMKWQSIACICIYIPKERKKNDEHTLCIIFKRVPEKPSNEKRNHLHTQCTLYRVAEGWNKISSIAGTWIQNKTGTTSQHISPNLSFSFIRVLYHNKCIRFSHCHAHSVAAQS